MLLEKNCADVLQPDITWVGGITEARRVVALAAAYDVMVIPHGSSVFSYHLQFAFQNCPMGELINLSPESDKIVPLFGNLFLDEPLPENGYVSLSNKPGFGVTLNKQDNNLVRPYPRTPKSFKEIQHQLNEQTPKQSEWLNKAATIPCPPHH